MMGTRLWIAIGCVVFSVVNAQGPRDGSASGLTPVIMPPVIPRTVQPTTIPPLVPLPPSSRSDSGSGTGVNNNNRTRTLPPPTTAPPITKPPTSKPPAAPESAVRPAAPTVAPPPSVVIDRTIASEYGTKAPSSKEATDNASQHKESAGSVGSWLVPAIIGFIVMIALAFVIVIVRNQRRTSDYEGNYDPRDTDGFFAPPPPYSKDPRDSGWQGPSQTTFASNTVQQKSSIITTTTGSPDSPRIMIDLRSESESSRPTMLFHDSLSGSYAPPKEGTSIAL